MEFKHSEMFSGKKPSSHPPELAERLRRKARDGGFYRESPSTDVLNLSLFYAIGKSEEGYLGWGHSTRVPRVYAIGMSKNNRTEMLVAASTSLDDMQKLLTSKLQEGWVLRRSSWEVVTKKH